MTELFFVGSGGRRTDRAGEHLRSSDARARLARTVDALRSIEGSLDYAYSSTHELDLFAVTQAFSADLPGMADPSLDQIRIGGFSGMPLREVLTEELIYSLQLMDFDFRFSDGETPREVATRVRNFVLNTEHRHPDGRAAVVAPEFVVRTFAAHQLGFQAVFACSEGVIFDPVTPVRVQDGKIQVDMCR